MGETSVQTSGRLRVSGRPRLLCPGRSGRICSPFFCAHMGPCRPECHQHRKRGERAADAQLASGEGGDTEVRQQKSEEGDATPNLL